MTEIARDESGFYFTTDFNKHEKIERNLSILFAREYGETYIEIGKRFDITPKRARQIYLQAKRRLKNPDVLANLASVGLLCD